MTQKNGNKGYKDTFGGYEKLNNRKKPRNGNEN